MPKDDLNIGQLLFIPYQALETRVFRSIAEAGFDDLTIAQAKLLQRIDRDGSRLTQLAAAAQVTKQTAGFLVDQLARAGYVERVPDPADARARLIRPTPRAAALAPIGAKVMADIEAEWTAHLGPGRMTQLREALTRLREITDPYR